jgi:hypothetical protein
MLPQSEQQRSPVWKCLLRGGVAGVLAGIVGGPIAFLAYMYLRNVMNGARFLGLEFVEGPLIGAFFGALEGPVLSLLWAFKPPRVTLWWLMVVVAAVGLMLGLLVYNPLLGVIALTIPVLMPVTMNLRAIIGYLPKM